MLHLDGFEQYANEANMLNTLTRADYVVIGTWASVAGRGRASRAISGPVASISRTVPWTTGKLSIGFTCSFTARGAMASVKVGSADLTFWINPDTGLPNLNNAIGGALPTKDRFYYYEITLDRATGNCELKINGRLDCQFSFNAALVGQTADVRLGWRPVLEYRPGLTPVPVDGGVKTFDDFYVRDSDPLGPIMITTRFPSVDVKAEWFKAGPQPTHAATLAMSPPQPLDIYVAADTVGKEDRFTSGAALQNTNAVIATGVVVLARKSPTLDARLGVFMGGSVSDRGEARTVESNWRTHFVCFEQRPGDTIENVQNSQFGINVTAP